MESPETVPNIGKITLDDSSMNDHKIDNATQGNRSLDNEMKYPQLGGSLSNGGGDLDSLTPKVVEKTGDAQNGVQEKKPTVKKPAARAKVPFEKGYSQMDWLKLTRTDPDLAGNLQISFPFFFCLHIKSFILLIYFTLRAVLLCISDICLPVNLVYERGHFKFEISLIKPSRSYFNVHHK